MADIEPSNVTDKIEVDPTPPTPTNACLLQGFEWYVPDDTKHWKRLKAAMPGLAVIGINNIWIPPACKASSKSGNGYDIYDLYDLGEFDQKGQKTTKWGPKEDLIEMRDAARACKIGLYFDAVLNHKAAADHTEKCMAVEVDNNDRNKRVSDPYEIEGWLGFDFPGRGDTYSAMKWHWYHFSGVDFNAANPDKTAIYAIQGEGKSWSDDVDREKGNFDYLMFADIDYGHKEVKQDVKNWGVWVAKELGLRGFRYDAIKHLSQEFLKEFLEHLDKELGQDWFFVGEFWKDSIDDLKGYLSRMNHKFSVFDTPLVYNFSAASQQESADISKIFDGTLVKEEPVNAVTLVTNHDTQPGQALQAKVEGFFQPLAYALILLRLDGYPCVFYGDLYGIKGDNPIPPIADGKLPDLILARTLYSYGEQIDYFDYPTCLGWVRKGTHDKKFGLACILSNAGPGSKSMFVGEEHVGEVWTDVLGWEQMEVTINQDGFGEFICPATSLAVFVNKEATGRDLFGKFNPDIYSMA